MENSPSIRVSSIEQASSVKEFGYLKVTYQPSREEEMKRLHKEWEENGSYYAVVSGSCRGKLDYRIPSGSVDFLPQELYKFNGEKKPGAYPVIGRMRRLSTY